MVLNPPRLIAKEKLYSGVSLNIPLAYQLQQIKKTFPERKRVGVFFSQGENKTVVESLRKEADLQGLAIVGLPITSASDILPAIASKDFSIDALLMIPDEQINSQKIVEYIIKEALRRTIPVVGYNSWFAKNGAILSFIIDYRDMGIQAGTMAMKLLKQGATTRVAIETPARIRVSIDEKTAQKLGIQIAPGAIQQADEVIR
jgi:putative ABC transport system substrate-binding protein